MTTIHMDVATLRTVQRNLQNVQSQIQRRLAFLRQNNNYLHNDWVGNSANEYLHKYFAIESRLTKIAQRLGDISGELSVEIAKWESMDNKFGI